MATGGYNIKEDCMLQGQAQFLFFHPKGQRNNNLKPNSTPLENQPCPKYTKQPKEGLILGKSLFGGRVGGFEGSFDKIMV